MATGNDIGKSGSPMSEGSAAKVSEVSDATRSQVAGVKAPETPGPIGSEVSATQTLGSTESETEGFKAPETPVPAGSTAPNVTASMTPGVGGPEATSAQTPKPKAGDGSDVSGHPSQDPRRSQKSGWRLAGALRNWLLSADGSRPAPMSAHEPNAAELKMVDNTKFLQDLNEVHMLLDHISGHPEKRLSQLSGKIPSPSDGSKALDATAIVNQVTKIGFDYSNSPETAINANHAAFLIIVKDALNYIAFPATGLTIAFTTLFTRRPKSNRAQSAAIAYPSLVGPADLLRRSKNWMVLAALILSSIAAFLLWQVTYGVQLAAHFDEAKKNDTLFAIQIYNELEKEKPSTLLTQNVNVNAVCGLDSGPVEEKGAPRKPSAAPGDKFKAATEKDPDRLESEEKFVRGVTLQKICDEYAYQHGLYCVAIADLGRYGDSWFFVFYRWFLPMHDLSPADKCGNGRPASSDGHQEDGRSIAGVLGALSNYFLPLLFGAVGALTSLVRGLGEKVAESLLSPRDLTIALIRLPMAVVAGVSVGLFLNPANVSSAANGSIGAFTVSASGIAFLAGYGAESFFGALDAVILRLFNITPRSNQNQKQDAQGTSLSAH